MGKGGKTGRVPVELRHLFQEVSGTSEWLLRKPPRPLAWTKESNLERAVNDPLAWLSETWGCVLWPAIRKDLSWTSTIDFGRHIRLLPQCYIFLIKKNTRARFWCDHNVHKLSEIQSTVIKSFSFKSIYSRNFCWKGISISIRYRHTFHRQFFY